MTILFNHGYALLIGVGQCAYSDWSLPTTVKDVQALKTILTNPNLCAYPDIDDHIRILHDQGATRQAILEGLKWLQTQVTADPEATIIFYYSGHGWLDTQHNRYYLIPHDVKPFNLPTSALSAEDFNAALQKISAKRFLVILDCCHAEGMASAKDPCDTPELPSGFVAVAPSKGLFDRLTQGEGRAVFTSCRGSQKSWIQRDGSLSLYTKHLVEALQGAANQPSDTVVKVSDLMKHLGRSVPDSAQREYQVEQIPWFSQETEDFAVALLQGGKGLSSGGWEAMQSQPSATQVMAQASGERSVAIGGNVINGTIVTGDRNITGSGNVIQQGNTIFNIHNTSHFSMEDLLSSRPTSNEVEQNFQSGTTNLKAIRQLIEAALEDDRLIDLCQNEFPAVYNQFTVGQTKSARIRLLVEYVDRQRLIPKLLITLQEANPKVYAEFEPGLLDNSLSSNSFVSKASNSSSTTVNLSVGQQQRLQQQRDTLQAEWTLRSQKLEQLRAAFVIESSAAYRFQLEHQIKEEEEKLARLEDELVKIEATLEKPNA
jgi:hypothetical protein